MTDYKKPTGPRIFRNEDTETLYKLEDEHRDTFRECALELGRVLECNPLRFYEETLPEAILTFLDGYDQNAVRLAVEVWLEKNPDPKSGAAIMKVTMDRVNAKEKKGRKS